MKKLAALLLVCSMLAAVTGCGDNKDSSSQAATEAASTAAATTEAATTEAPTEAPSTERPAPTPTVDENAITFEDGDLPTRRSSDLCYQADH